VVTLLTLVAAALLGGVDDAAAQASGAGRIAYINSREILRQTPGYAAAESTFSRELEGYRAEVVRLQQTLDSAATAFEQSSVMLSPSQRDARRQELQTQQQQLEERAQALQQQAATRERELLEPIRERINQAIDGVRADGSYALILDIAAPNTGIVSADPALDLTDRVIERLRAGAGGS
jgi:outer membrane protein